MKLKYYLRGIGIGMIFSLVMLAFVNPPKKMTDEEIIAAAKKLGMIEEKSSGSLLSQDDLDTSVTPEAESLISDVPLPSITDIPYVTPEVTDAPDDEIMPSENPPLSTTPIPTNTPLPTSTPVPTPTKMPTTTPVPTPTKMPTSTPVPSPTTTPVPTSTPPPTNTPVPSNSKNKGEKVTINVTKGMTSYQFSDIAEKNGLVDRAEDFDHYLVLYGFSEMIQIGKYDFYIGDSYYRIAEILTGGQ